MPTTSTQSNDSAYIDSLDYKKWSLKFKQRTDMMDTQRLQNQAARDMRYVEIDIEGERQRGKLLPDELLIPQHIVDTNIRREQPAYVQYDTQSPRAVILQDIDDPSRDTTILEKDLTNRIRYEGWQIPRFANIDNMQQNGAGFMELVYDESKAGSLAHEYIAHGDFGYSLDTKDLQEDELLVRNYYYSKTKLIELSKDKDFSKEQLEKIYTQKPNNDNPLLFSGQDDKSLYVIQKLMFRVKGVVHVAWAGKTFCDDWIRKPRPLYIGRRKEKKLPVISKIMSMVMPNQQQSPETISEPDVEYNYPYYNFPYLISENSTISQAKGRVQLDQDTQQAVMSIVSSYCTALRRASGLYFSKEVDDPNDDVLMDKNVFFRQGSLINSKVKSMQLSAPPADCLSAINLLVTANQQETAKVNFAANNRQDSRKTATEVDASLQEAAQLSTVQVILYSESSRKIYVTMFEIIASRVKAGIIQVNDVLKEMYSRKYSIRPSGDIDVVERQKIIQAMMGAWPVVSNTPAAVPFLMDMLSKMFPENASKYNKIIQEADAAQKSAQAQQQQMMLAEAMKYAKGLMHVSKHSEYFSDIGKIHALPAIQQAAEQLKEITGGQ